MSNDRQLGKPLTGEVLPPQRGDAFLPIERPLQGIPFLNRMRYRSVQKELALYLEVLQTKNSILRELDEALRIERNFHLSLAQTERLPDLKTIVGLQIDAELNAAIDNLVDQSDQAAIRSIHRRRERADAEARALEAEQRLEAMQNPAPAPTPPPTLSQSERMTSEIAKFREVETDLIAALTGDIANENDLPEEEQELILTVRLATRDRITSLIEDFGR